MQWLMQDFSVDGSKKSLGARFSIVKKKGLGKARNLGAISKIRIKLLMSYNILRKSMEMPTFLENFLSFYEISFIYSYFRILVGSVFNFYQNYPF